MRFDLQPHPDTPPGRSDMTLEVWLERWDDGRAEISYHLHGPTDGIVLPDQPRGRADELWQTTCFELFVKDGEGYSEYNFSPSGAWAAYRFDGYRAGMRPLETARPQIDMDDHGDAFLLDAVIDLEGEGRLSLAAVVEEASGTKSYWALAHGPGKPDFHAEACFAATLPPPTAA